MGNKLKKPKPHPSSIHYRNPYIYQSGERYIAIHDYQANNEDELSFKVDDILICIKDVIDKDWIEMRHKRTKEVGRVPQNHVLKMSDLVINKRYFFDISRVVAERKLQDMNNIPGTFLIRPSRQSNSYALSYLLKVDNVFNVYHSIIEHVNHKYKIGGKEFKNTDDLINYFHKFPIRGTNGYLTETLSSDKPAVPFRQLDIDRSNFTLISKLGSGNFGEVSKAQWGRSLINYVAVKQMISDNNKATKETRDNFLKEAKLMHNLKHPNIVNLLAVCTQPNTEPIWIVTEYLEMGDLLSYLKKIKTGKIKLDNLLNILMDFVYNISKGMNYLESQKYVHCDLRACNVLLTGDLVAKVADFGLSKAISEEEGVYNVSKPNFPVRWTAPEAMDGEFSSKSDVWSFGIVLYEIITLGEQPYRGKKPEEIMRIIRIDKYRLPEPSGTNCSKELYRLMEHCWSEKPDDRPSFEFIERLFSEWQTSLEEQYG